MKRCGSLSNMTERSFTMAINFTKSQQSAIDSVGKSVVVSAAAGSGKTAVLVERIMKRITGENPIDIDRLLIVTFTTAAAADMKAKIGKRLAEQILAEPQNKNLLRQQLLLQSASIGTTHSFCLDLIGNNFSKLGIAPDMRVGKDETLVSLKQGAASKAISLYFEENEEEAAELALVVSGGRSDRDFESAVIKFAEGVRARFDGERLFLDDINAVEKNCIDYLKNYIAELFLYVKSCFERAQDYCADALEVRVPGLVSNAQMAQKVIESCKEPGYLVFGMLNELEIVKLKAKPRGSSDEDAASGRELFDAAKKAIEIAKKLSAEKSDIKEDFAYNKRIVTNLFSLAKSYLHFYSESKEEKSLLDYTDLELLAIKLLYENGEISERARYLQGQFDEIYVDEYQDANDIQDMIYKAISTDENNIFMVGDVKQSIYGFRGAVPKLFIDKQREFSDGAKGELIRLQNNFRSAENVVSFVNTVFLHNMIEDFSGINYSEERLVCTSPLETKGEAKLLTYQKQEGKRAVETEAVAVAKRIRYMIDSGVTVLDGDGERPCKYGDFAILLRVCKGVDSLFSHALKELGIPSVVREDKLLFDAPEISVLISFLQALHNPTLDIPLLATMLSPIFALSAEKLTLMKKGNRKSFSKSVFSSEDSEIKEFLKSFQEMRTKCATMPILEFLKGVVSECGYSQSMRYRYKDSVVTQNIRLFFEMLQEMQDRGSVYLSSVVFELDNMRRLSINPPAAASLSAGDKVGITTIHKSKGLEYKICFVCDLAHQLNYENTARVLLDRELCCGVKRILPGGDFQADSLAFKIIKLKKTNDTIKEYLRVLYVALTRAEQKLFLPIEESVLMGEKSPPPLPYELSKGNSLLSFIKNISGALPKEPIDEGVIELPTKEVIADMADVVSDKLLSKIESEYRFLDSTKTEAKLSVTELVHKEDGFAFMAQPMFAKGPTAADRGTAVHKLLQFIDFEKNVSDEVERLLSDGTLSEEQGALIDIEQINRLIKGALSDIIGRGELMRELRFLSAIEQNFGDKSILQGVVDAVVVANDGLYIIDYKTDRVSDISLLRERYDRQLSLYAKALESHFGKPVLKKYLVSVYKNEVLEV